MKKKRQDRPYETGGVILFLLGVLFAFHSDIVFYIVGCILGLFLIIAML